jgi:hypothetical protein
MWFVMNEVDGLCAEINFVLRTVLMRIPPSSSTMAPKSAILLFTLWGSLIPQIEGQLKHMRKHGHDHAHQHVKSEAGIDVDFDELPGGIPVSPQGKILHSPHKFVMRAGYREYKDSKVAPWISNDRPAKGSVIDFLESARK